MDQGVAIRWDIVEEHLDEAGFLHQLWEEALRSPVYTLAEIAEGPEERLLAHLDGLVLAGPPAAKKLLLPALGGDEPGLVFAASFALADGGRPEDLAAVLEALAKAEPGPRAAIRRALGVVPRADLGQRLAAEAVRAPPPLQADLVDVLGYLRVDPGVRLEPFASSKEPGVRAIALRAARAFPSRLDPRAVELALADPAREVRAAALEAGFVTGLRAALGACEAEVSGRGPAFATAALLSALGGDEKAVAPLVKALADEETRPAAAFALGFTGRVSAAGALVDLMTRSEELAPVAAEGLAAIAGLAVEKGLAREPPRWSPEAAEEEEVEPYGPEADLPAPEPEAVARWWKEAQPRLDPARRWLRGLPWSPEAVLGELEQGPARRREALALDLAVRSRGAAFVAWDALSVRQRQELSGRGPAPQGR